MREAILVGRGGQGIMLASQILADTFLRAGRETQTSPEFKAERRGAPIAASLREDNVPIVKHYKARSCDVLIGINPSAATEELLAQIKPRGLLIINRTTHLPYRGSFRIIRVPASRIARELGIVSPEGRPLGNTAVLGACIRMLLPDAMPLLEEAIDARMGFLAEINRKAAQMGYTECEIQQSKKRDIRIVHEEPKIIFDAASPPQFAITREFSLENITGTWKEEKPVFTEQCSVCCLCGLVCPEDVITKENGIMHVDEAHCKGCGICADFCPVANAIRMEEVIP